MNKVVLMGRLTKDVDFKQTENGVSFARYSIAVRRKYTKQGEADVDFFNVVAFGKAAEFVDKFFNKGDMIAVVGRLQVETWEKDGEKKTGIKVIAEEQHFCGGKSNGDNTTHNDTAQDDTDENLPF